MFWTLVATAVCGLGAAGIALGIRTLTKKKAPRWIVPVFAGAGMFGYLIYGEYTWFDHRQTQLPENTEVVDTSRESAIWRPWSLIDTPVSGFTVLDRSTLRESDTQDGVFRFRLYRFERNQSGQVPNSGYVMNCQSAEMARLTDEGEIVPDSLRRLSPENGLMTSVCR